MRLLRQKHVLIKVEGMPRKDGHIHLQFATIFVSFHMGTNNIKRYRERLDKFEEQFNMSSKEFLKQFKSGKLGDEPQWFEWEYFLEVYEGSLKQVNQ